MKLAGKWMQLEINYTKWCNQDPERQTAIVPSHMCILASNL